MPHNRFYCAEELKAGSTILLAGAEHHHLARVMRIRKGEEVELVNGKGTLGKALVLKSEAREILLHILSSELFPPLLPFLFTAIPLMRPSKLEEIVERGTELGADAFLFYEADLSEKRGLTPHQIERLRALSISALKQSGRLYLPSFEFLPHLEEIFQKEALFLFGDVRPNALKNEDFSGEKAIVFITGPEKGFSERERVILEKKGKGIGLSPFILRAETAPLAALARLR